ncbi:MAG TPA: SpoVR family protein [Planctomycetota bacterium]|jgi:stage V sporulation protein R|nr:SpoVR family protein [Planctomycetota bacterium]
MAALSADLERERSRIEGIAFDYGLTFPRTIFELLDHDELNEVASYGGFPTRYPHWRFGMDFEELAKGYRWGLQKIYELVINNDPCYAYLMKSNATVDQKLVIAHVYGHADFFQNNLWFAPTNRRMVDQMANHGIRIRRYMEAVGVEAVEDFLDATLSLDNLIDPYASYPSAARRPAPPEEEPSTRVEVPRLKAKGYMDRYINPPGFLEGQRTRLERERAKAKKFPPEPVRDVLQFLIEYAPLERWQADILGILREEALYFAPQAMTKIMNEGWATYWHSRILTHHVLGDDEVIDYADHHSGTVFMAPGRLNPYKIGVELWRDIEERWNRGCFGPEWEACEDAEERRRWDRETGQGLPKMFEVRRIYNDVTFLDEFLTPEFVEEHRLFAYRTNPRTGQREIADRDPKAVREAVLRSLTHLGRPWVAIADANGRNRGELHLHHRHEEIDLEIEPTLATLKNLHKIWTRPVLLETQIEGKGKVLSFDGKEAKVEDAGPGG